VEEVPYEKRFHFGDGTAVKDLAELKGKVETISYDEFYGHVNDEKNDFANWVEHVIGDSGLAERLRKVTSIVETVELLNEAVYPGESQQHEAELGDADIQHRIEEELFQEQGREAPREQAQPSEPAQSPEQAAPPADEGSEWTAEQEEGEEVALPSKEELELAGRTPGAPVTSNDPAHVPVTEKVGKPVSSEEHLKFLVRQALYGFLIGLIVGFVLGRVISIFL